MKTGYFAAALAISAIAGCKASIGADQSDSSSADQISQTLAQWQKAFEAKDVNGVMAMYAAGNAVTSYDLVPPLQYTGADAYRKDYTDFFGQFDGPLRVELRDSHIEAGGNIAFAYGLERISGKLKSGEPVDIWVRYTSGFKRIDGQWRDVHDHVSVPVDIGTSKAMLDLKP